MNDIIYDFQYDGLTAYYCTYTIIVGYQRGNKTQRLHLYNTMSAGRSADLKALYKICVYVKEHANQTVKNVYPCCLYFELTGKSFHNLEFLDDQLLQICLSYRELRKTWLNIIP